MKGVILLNYKFPLPKKKKRKETKELNQLLNGHSLMDFPFVQGKVKSRC